MIQPASNSTTSVGTGSGGAMIKPERVTFLKNLLLVLSQTLRALLTYLSLATMPQDAPSFNEEA